MALVLLVVACGATRVEPEEWRARVAEIEEQAHTAAQAVTSDERLEDPLHAGERAVFLVERSTRGEVQESWEVVLTAPANTDESYGLWKANLSGGGAVYRLRSLCFEGAASVGARGGESTKVRALMPLGLTRLGLLGAIEESLAELPGAEEKAEASMPLILGLSAVLSLQRMVDELPVLRKLVLRCVQLPSWWTWLRGGFEMGVVPSFDEAVAVTGSRGNGWAFPMKLEINGDPALYGRLTAVPATGVLQMTAGIVDFIGYAPNAPEKTVRVRFLEARGPEGAVQGPILESDYWLELPR